MEECDIIGIRYFQEETYAKDFIEGRIFFNSAGVFRDIPNPEQHYSEGRVPYFTNEIIINGNKFTGDIRYTWYYEEDDRVPICCFSYITPSDIQNGVFNADERMKKTYKYFVVFNIGDLLTGLTKALENTECGLIAHPIEYVDFNDKTNPATKLDLSYIPVYYKRFFIHSNENAHQKEFRIIITGKMFDVKGQHTKIDIAQNWSSVPLRICELR